MFLRQPSQESLLDSDLSPPPCVLYRLSRLVATVTDIKVVTSYLQNYIPEDKLIEVKRVLYGSNRGAPVQQLPLSQKVHDAARSAGFDIKGYRFTGRQEQNRQPRTVKIGLIQNSIKAPTTAPYADQTKVPTYACDA